MTFIYVFSIKENCYKLRAELDTPEEVAKYVAECAGAGAQVVTTDVYFGDRVALSMVR